jgi:thiamine transport system substrate-binding protein
MLAGCQGVGQPPAVGVGATNAVPASEPARLIVATHDSFAVGEDVIAAFEAAQNAKVEFLAMGDAGKALNTIILSKDAPLADLFFGVDNTFLSRALAADVFAPYASPALATVPAELRLDESNRLTPVDYGFVTLNADPAWFAAQGLPLPQTLEDLIKPEYSGTLVVENPATSSPGLAFLLTTIAYFGEDGYLDYWTALRANEVLVTEGWSDAYYTHFTVGSGGQGNRPLVVSYSSSPPADVIFAADGRTEPASVNIAPAGGSFRQIEFAGLLKNARSPELARRFIDFLLSPAFQADVPLQMFVYPVLPGVELPEVFVQFGQPPAEPARLAPAAIDANRERWIEAWTNAVLR